MITIKNGSEKQIEWAKDIRSRLLSDPKGFKNGYKEKLEKEQLNLSRAIKRGRSETSLKNYRYRIEVWEKMIDFMENRIDSAQWFFDNQGINNGIYRLEKIVEIVENWEK